VLQVTTVVETARIIKGIGRESSKNMRGKRELRELEACCGDEPSKSRQHTLKREGKKHSFKREGSGKCLGGNAKDDGD